MTYLTIAFPEAVKDYIDRQISSGTYSTPDEFLTALVEQEQERRAKQKVNALLKSTLGKDRKVEATDEWWQQQRQQLIDSLPPGSKIDVENKNCDRETSSSKRTQSTVRSDNSGVIQSAHGLERDFDRSVSASFKFI